MKMVLVEWIDPCSSGPFWEDRESIEALTPTPSITIGLMEKETEEDIRLVMSRNDCKYSQAIAINKSCIKRIRQLKIVDELGEK